MSDISDIEETISLMRTRYTKSFRAHDSATRLSLEMSERLLVEVERLRKQCVGFEKYKRWCHQTCVFCSECDDPISPTEDFTGDIADDGVLCGACSQYIEGSE